MNHSIFKNLSKILYPSRCPICGKVPSGTDHCCSTCYDSITFVKQPFCYSCGKPLEQEETEYCHDCISHPKSFTRGFALCVYDGITKPSLSSIKYKNKRTYLTFYAEETLNRYGSLLSSYHFDAILPVPIHPKRMKKRGFNQASLFAHEMGSALHIPVYDTLLLRTHNTQPQKNLTPAQRLKNLQKAFDIHPDYKNRRIPLHRVLLVDDIYTTGATMEAITRLLLDHGVKEVYIFSICIGKGF